MDTLGNASADDLREIMAGVEGKKPTQRLMAAINYLEGDNSSQNEVAERYGNTDGWLSRRLDQHERLHDEPFEGRDDPNFTENHALEWALNLRFDVFDGSKSLRTTLPAGRVFEPEITSQ